MTVKKTLALQPISFRLRKEIVQIFKKLTDHINNNFNMRLSEREVLEMIIIYAATRDVKDFLHCALLELPKKPKK